MRFDFPGNVRQLENICHWLTVMAPAQLVESKDLPPELHGPAQRRPAPSSSDDGAGAAPASGRGVVVAPTPRRRATAQRRRLGAARGAIGAGVPRRQHGWLGGLERAARALLRRRLSRWSGTR